MMPKKNNKQKYWDSEKKNLDKLISGLPKEKKNRIWVVLKDGKSLCVQRGEVVAFTTKARAYYFCGGARWRKKGWTIKKVEF
jgi:hypothetical protein